MPLSKVAFLPGFNKQLTASGAQNRWIDGDFVRFRYGMPEKIGGWEQISENTLPGAGRKSFVWTDLLGNKLLAVGTNKVLGVYFEGEFHDITPLDTDLEQSSVTFTTVNGSNQITMTFPTDHNLFEGHVLLMDNVTLPGSGTSFTAGQFEDQKFEVIGIPSTTIVTLEAPATETGAGITGQGSVTIKPYYFVGNAVQTYGYGWGTAAFGAGAWGSASTSTQIIIDPGQWQLDNFGQNLIATIRNGRTFEWNPTTGGSITSALSTRATVVSGCPTTSVTSIVSEKDRHLILFGTETTIGTASTQDKMFIRFSDQENLNDFVPTSVNTAGSLRISSGSEIRAVLQAKDYIFILTDKSAYVMQFVGPPFTFSLRQVGSNCGCIGHNAAVHVDGVSYWMGDSGGFFLFDGTVKSMSCNVEDFVFTDRGDNLGINYDSGQIVYAGVNNLYQEVIWFYPQSGQDQIDRYVTYSFGESGQVPGGVWTTGSLARSSWVDADIYDLPYATEYDSTTNTTNTPLIYGNTQGRTLLYAHETGNNAVDYDGNATAIQAYIQSGDFEIDQGGNGEFFMKIRRFIPDFKNLSGNAKVTINTRRYPSNTATSSPLGPFTITTSTEKVDTRARSRLCSIKIENDSTNETWRYGEFRVDIQPDGRR